MTVRKGSGLDHLIREMPAGLLLDNIDRERVLVAASRVVMLCMPYLKPSDWDLQHHEEEPDENELQILRSRCLRAAELIYIFLESDLDQPENPWTGRKSYQRSHGLFNSLAELLGMPEHELIARCERTAPASVYHN